MGSRSSWCVALVVAALIMTSGCSQEQVGTPSAVSDTGSSTATSDDSSGTSTTDAGTTGDGSATGGVTGSGGGTGTGGGQNGPAVVAFSASRQTCKPGDAFGTVTLTWKVTGADNATLEVGPGMDTAYPPDSSLDFDAPCDGKAHTFSVWPGGDQSAKRSITVASGGTGSGGGNPNTPAVAAFSVSRPTCKAGATSAPVTVTWKVAGVDNATVEQGTPGDDVAYPPASSVTLAFPCDGKAHTYAVWPGGDQAAKRSATVTAING